MRNILNKGFQKLLNFHIGKISAHGFLGLRDMDRRVYSEVNCCSNPIWVDFGTSIPESNLVGLWKLNSYINLIINLVDVLLHSLLNIEEALQLYKNDSRD